MNIDETMKVMQVLQAVYTESFKDKTDEALKIAIKSWHYVFKDDPYELVQASVMSHISSSTSAFMPTPGMIKQLLLKISHPESELGEQ